MVPGVSSRVLGVLASMTIIGASVRMVAVAAQDIGAERTVARLGEYVSRYYERAQSLMADEAVAVQPLDRDLSAVGFARRLQYELRLEWNPSAVGDDSPATITRQLVAVNGKPPRPQDEPKCLDPKGISPEPLAFLLPGRRHEFTFKSRGVARIDGRAALLVEYRSMKTDPPKAEGDKDCISFDIPGRARGRVWADPETAEIVRFDEQLTGMVDVPSPPAQQRRAGSPLYWTIERADTSIVYRRVSFQDPEETLVLPARIESVTVIRGAGSVQRTRFTQTLTNYRRFITESRVVQ
jgi:hypothetical protein